MQWPHFYGGERVKSPRQHYVHAGWHSSEMSVGLWRKQSIIQAKFSSILILLQISVDILHHLLRILAAKHIFATILKFNKETIT